MRALAGALVLGLAASTAQAAPLPELRGRVNDLAGVLSGDRHGALEQRLAEYETRTGHQFVVLIIDSLDGDPIEDFAIRLAEKWKLGDAKRDDGLIFIVAKSDRKMRIEVGYGLEGAVPDVLAKRVLDDYVTPRFRAGDFVGGIELGLEQLMKAAEGEALGPPPARRGAERPVRSPARGGFLPALFLIFFVIMFLAALRFALPALVGALFGYTVAGIFGAIVGGLIGLMLGFMSRGGGGGGRGGWGGGSSGFTSGFSGGGFSSGGFSGGGFSGGGGSFGGGGASGSW